MAKRGIIFAVAQLFPSVKEVEEAKMALNTLSSSQPLTSPQQTAARRFDWISWLTLVLALGLILLSTVQKAYRLTLPTDGWSFITGDVGSADQDRPTYQVNLLGQPSPLRWGDRLLAVEGRPFESIYAQANAGQVQPLPNWHAGQTVQYTVEREGRPIIFDVPLYTWPPGKVLQQILISPGLWASVLLAAVGWFVFFKRPTDWAARALLLFNICLLVVDISSAGVQWSLPEILTPGILPIATFCSNWIFAVVMFPSLLLLTLVFPHPKPFVRQHPRPVLALLYGLVPLLIISFGPIATIGWVSVLVMALLSLAAMAHSFFTVRDPIGRVQMRWAVGGLVLMVLGFIPMNLSGLGWLSVTVPLWLDAIWFPMMLVMVTLGFGVAILRYRLFDIDIIINRALVYGTLTMLVIGLYVFVVGYLGAIFRTETNLFISLVATGLVAVLFQPLRDRLQRGVNRLMYGQRDEPVAVLSQLGARMEATLAPDEILPGLVDTIAQTLKLPYVAVALQVGDQLKVQAERGQASDLLETFPLIYQGQPIGQLRVAPRSPGEAFNPADRLLLTNIAYQAGAVAHAVQLTAALQQSRQRLVTAREEERRRLRRDLHDGLGPQLASQTLTLNAIGKLLERDPTKARELLDHLQTQSQAAIHDIRRLVYALRPPALDELGLVAALREGARHYEQASGCVEITTTPHPLPALPAAVEVAVYRIAQEAITNVIRHTQAKNCRVAITAHNQHLDLTIADDGPGFPPEFHFGVGLNSMRERAEELGGHIRFENQPQGGTQVQVWLPLPGDEE
jgi:signal transduction histidine kinase